MKTILLLVTLSACVFADDVAPSDKRSYQEKAGQDVRDQLMGKLFESYNKASYPENTTINFGMTLLDVHFDEKHNHVHSDVWFRMMWEDKRLSWDKEEFDVDVLRVPSELIWNPDVNIYNGKQNSVKCDATNAIVTSTGSIIFVPPCEMITYCNLTLTTDPYQEQICEYKFGSWTFDAWTMGLEIYKNVIVAQTEKKADTSYFLAGNRYQITTNTAVLESRHYDCCKEPYMDILYTIGFTKQRPGVEHCTHN